ncbi:hypothetical protein CLU79DRAFT_733982 [Phycomyces nitens]|nr:hypothetical protein CLU79DRAFT_733982 [Phycomyces nitens]
MTPSMPIANNYKSINGISTPTSSSMSISSPRESSNKINAHYGSVLSTPPYLDTDHAYGAYGAYGAHESHLNLGRPSSFTTTVGPDDNDEGLYLMWTHELLRERGFTPVSCRSEVDEDEDNDDNNNNGAGQDSDCQSTDSSLDHSPTSYRPQFLFSPAPSFLAESLEHNPRYSPSYQQGYQQYQPDPGFSLSRLFSLSFCCFH